jgi:hypothetical protein
MLYKGLTIEENPPTPDLVVVVTAPLPPPPTVIVYCVPAAKINPSNC